MRSGSVLSWSAVFSATALLLFQVTPVRSFTSYANDFVDPTYVLSGDFSNITIEAQATIVQWADQLAAEGPWSVMNKTYAAPSGTKHDYMSWAPYWWPNCTGVGNTTELTPQEIWVTCPYYVRDGEFNPDGRTIDDVGEFDDFANAVLFNALAWVINGSSVYAANAASYVNTWFLDSDTLMNPNLNYGQMERGPTGQNGTHTGILDLKCMAKIASGVLVLRNGKAAEWTSDIDSGFTSWVNEYIGWLTTADIALQEKAAANNHGTFYYNQLAALQLISGDSTGAAATVEEYFTSQYMSQISANGDQPLESARTRPYHYRAYNLAAMITNARIGAYVGYNAWNLTTTNGSTIQNALTYAMAQPAGNDTASELYPNIVAVGATYGDADNTLAKWMLTNAGNDYPADAQFLWNQPFSDEGLVKITAAGIRQEDGALGVGASWMVLATALGAALLALA